MRNYYIQHGLMSDPKNFKYLFGEGKYNADDIIEIVQNNLIHISWLWAYDDKDILYAKKEEVNLRSMTEKLEKLHETEESILIKKQTRSKLVSNCRDHSLFCCSLFRHIGIPSRVRCGFAKYLTKGKYEDHWITEYFDEKRKSWVMVDSQLDKIQKSVLNINFDTKDIPSNMFLKGGEAWNSCRKKENDPKLFGILDWWGMDYLLSNLILDVTGILKTPMLPWDLWDGIKSVKYERLSSKQLYLLDNLASLLENVDENFKEIESIYNNFLKVPLDLSNVKSYHDMLKEG